MKWKKFTSNCWSWYNASINWNLVTIFGSSIHSVKLQKERKSIKDYNFLFYFHPVPLFSHTNNFSKGRRKKISFLQSQMENAHVTLKKKIFFFVFHPEEKERTKYVWDETRICDSWKNFFSCFSIFCSLFLNVMLLRWNGIKKSKTAGGKVEEKQKNTYKWVIRERKFFGKRAFTTFNDKIVVKKFVLFSLSIVLGVCKCVCVHVCNQ